MNTAVCSHRPWYLLLSLLALVGSRPAAAQDPSLFPTVTILDDDGPLATNHAPFVGITSPRNGEVFPAPADILVAASVFDPDGFFGTVEFFEGTNNLRIPVVAGPTSPFLITWSNVPAGFYELTAKATDEKGATGLSSVVHVLVVETNVVPQPVVNIYAIDDTGREITPLPPWLYPADFFDSAHFTVTRTGPVDSPLTIFYRIGGTASNGSDYVRLPENVTIPAGASSAPIDVWVINDFEIERGETVELTLQAPDCIAIFPPPPGCYRVGASNQATAVILDNDTESNLPPVVTIVATDPDASEAGLDAGTFTIRRTGPTNGAMSVFYSTGGSAQNGIDYQELSDYVVIPAGARSAEITLTPLDDAFVEGPETVVVQLGPMQIRWWGGGGGGIPDPAVPVVWPPYIIGYPSNAVVAIADKDFGRTNLLPVVNIVARDPFASEGTNFWRSDWDANWWAIDVWNPWRVNLGGTNTATFVVRRHGPTNDDVTVDYEIGGTASNGVDYVALPGSVTIPAGKHSAQIVVVPIEDTLAEGVESVVLSLEQPAVVIPLETVLITNPPPPIVRLPSYQVGFPSRASAIIIDHDQSRPTCLLLPDHQFHLCQPATNGFCFRVEASTDLRHWFPLCTNVVTDGALHFVDPDSSALDARFYRAEPEPGVPPDD